MIFNYSGDVFLSPTNIVIHQCNCFHTFGSGIAKTIKEMFPETYKSDLKTDFADKKKLGTFNLTKVKYDKNRNLRFICNLYGQYHFGRDKCYTNYEALQTGFSAIEKQMNNSLVEVTVAIPYKLGCVNAGGDWNKVMPILTSVFGKSQVKLLICNNEVV